MVAPRVRQPVVGTQVGKAEAALVADPALVDLEVVTGEDPLDLRLADGRVDVADRRGRARTRSGCRRSPTAVPRSGTGVGSSAPTGQSSVTLPVNAPVYGRSSNVVMTDAAPRLAATSCPSSLTSELKRVQR
jgi:hypothetical protein